MTAGTTTLRWSTEHGCTTSSSHQQRAEGRASYFVLRPEGVKGNVRSLSEKKPNFLFKTFIDKLTT
jgi:hypothetical protein